MSDRLQQVNQGLRTLDEAHYRGRISREEYRLRRRQLLGALCDSRGITARHTLRGAASPPAAGSPPARPVAGARPAVAWRLWLGFALGAVLCLLLVYWLLAAPG